jgi:hypothetical protein
MREKGRLWRRTLPVPLRVARNKPSPPKNMDLRLPVLSIS